ncbi:UNVERIFIED_CONTAM: glyoxylase-like metal-dependent hydrolase (beta-lactamase superfamily II) [Acetivibrio alkalicellulosi]
MHACEKKVIKKDGISIHIFVSPIDGEMVNSIIVESKNSLVIIDVPLLRPYSLEFRNYAEQIGKPIDRVIVTHAHPDHWASLEHYKDIPIYSTLETKKEIKELGDWMLGYHRQIHGSLISDEKVVPEHIIDDGSFTIDGVTYTAMKVFDTEYKSMLVLDIPKIKTLIAQDMIYNKVYLFLGEKTSSGELCCDNWIKEIEKYKLNNYETIIPGHGEPTDASLLDENIKYLKAAKEIIISSKSGEEFKTKIMEEYPEYRVPFLLDMTAYLLYEANG